MAEGGASGPVAPNRCEYNWFCPSNTSRSEAQEDAASSSMRGMDERFNPGGCLVTVEPTSGSTSPGETKLLASEIYEILQLAGKEEAEQAEAAAASCQRKAQFFLGSNNKRAKTVVLHIDGLDDSARRSLCEAALLKIRGVISFTFQMAVKRCVVRIRSDLTAEALGTAINSTKVMIAQQVVRTEGGEELILPFQEGSEALVEENTDIPDYLPEEESPSEEQDKAVTRVGSITDGMGWLNTAANFLTRSFYW
uniref:Armadillo repeat containing 1 n=1 Tax=Gasterosteus aculeatus aculeatus TaxID=481459 RepID=A0AAQ4P5E7_GASAC